MSGIDDVNDPTNALAEWTRHGNELIDHALKAVGRTRVGNDSHYADMSAIVSDVIEQLQEKLAKAEESVYSKMVVACPEQNMLEHSGKHVDPWERLTSFINASRQERHDLKAKLAKVERTLEAMSEGSPPDDWDYYSLGDYNGYGYSGDPAYVDEPDTSNGGDMFNFGADVGRWTAAKIVRACLKTIKGSSAPVSDERILQIANKLADSYYSPLEHRSPPLKHLDEAAGGLANLVVAAIKEAMGV